MQAPSDAERNQAAQRASIERANALGRWPANVVLLHDPACQRTGTRRVPTGVAVRRNQDPEAFDEGSIFRKRKSAGDDFTHGDGDGLETVEAWACVEGCPVAELDRQSGPAGASAQVMGTEPSIGRAANTYGDHEARVGRPAPFYGDQGGASRFFYSGKASPAEREYGLEALDVGGNTKRYGTMQEPQLDRAAPRENWTPRDVRNTHPTVKPIDLMRWLVRLVTPPDGVVLDPFAGSGSTGCAAVLEGRSFVGIERDARFLPIARARVAAWAKLPPGTSVAAVIGEDGARRRDAAEHEERRRALASAGQLDLLAGGGEA